MTRKKLLRLYSDETGDWVRSVSPRADAIAADMRAVLGPDREAAVNSEGPPTGGRGGVQAMTETDGRPPDTPLHRLAGGAAMLTRDRLSAGASERMRVAYVAGPYRAGCEWGVSENIRRAENVALVLWRTGFAVVCPQKNTAFMGGSCPDETWLSGYLEILQNGERFVVLSDALAAYNAFVDARSAE